MNHLFTPPKRVFENLFIHPRLLDHTQTKYVLERIFFRNLVEIEGERHPGNGLLLTFNRGAYFKPCPGQKGNICCGYWVLEWGLGCPFHCEYCVLQNYIRPGDITWYMNWEQCHSDLEELRRRVSGIIRIGSGEFGDSLALEDLFPLNTRIISHAAKLQGVSIEVKTKSDNVAFLEHLNPRRHVVAAFSLNPASIVDSIEHGTASLYKRLNAARQAHEWGYALAFHFDPMIPIEGWRDAYLEVLNAVRRELGKATIAWISLGTFRFPKGFRDIAEERYPQTRIFSEEFHACGDGKMRYFRPLREELYRFMLKGVAEILPQTPVYACMESPEVWERLTGETWTSCRLKSLLDATENIFNTGVVAKR